MQREDEMLSTSYRRPLKASTKIQRPVKGKHSLAAAELCCPSHNSPHPAENETDSSNESLLVVIQSGMKPAISECYPHISIFPSTQPIHIQLMPKVLDGT